MGEYIQDSMHVQRLPDNAVNDAECILTDLVRPTLYYHRKHTTSAGNTHNASNDAV